MNFDLKDIAIVVSLIGTIATLAYTFGHLRGTVATKDELKALEDKTITNHNAQLTLLNTALIALQRSVDAIKMKLWPGQDPTKD
jgi:hypothetical protein